MEETIKETIIVSAINIFEGGPLTVLQECLNTLSEKFSHKYQLVALVHDSSLFKQSDIKFIEFPKSRKSYINRLFYEYFKFRKLSKELKPLLWFSLHDLTPNVDAKIRAVYCHNPSPFFKPKYIDLKYSLTVTLFSLFYKKLYRINIKQNNYVIVQQQWIAKKFIEFFKLQKEKMLVARPYYNVEVSTLKDKSGSKKEQLFFYPSYPRTFKNFELICEACLKLNSEGVLDYKVILTIDGSENKYSSWLCKKYSGIETIKFTGILKRDKVFEFYHQTDCLIFPSRLETWGLPISEYAAYNKPMLLADLPYAYETSEKCLKTSFFNPNNSTELASKMKKVILGDTSFFKPTKAQENDLQQTNSWEELFNRLLCK